MSPRCRPPWSRVDRQLERGADLRARLAQAWAQLQCPYALERGALRCDPQPSEQGTWLQWRPEGLAAGPLASTGKLLHVAVGLDGALAVTRGEPPAAQAQSCPRSRCARPKTGFELHVPVAFGYDLITNQLAAALPSQPLPFGKEDDQVRVTQARVVGADPSAEQRLLLELHLAGAVEAVIYVERGAARGRPRARLRRARLHAADPAALRRPAVRGRPRFVL